MRQAVDILSQKHKQLIEEINAYKTSLSTAESEIKRLSGIGIESFLKHCHNFIFYYTECNLPDKL